MMPLHGPETTMAADQGIAPVVGRMLQDVFAIFR